MRKLFLLAGLGLMAAQARGAMRYHFSDEAAAPAKAPQAKQAPQAKKLLPVPVATQAETPAPHPTPATTAAPLPPAPSEAPQFKLKGLLKVWVGGSEHASSHAFDQAGAKIKHLRLRLEARPAPGLEAVVMPELSSGFELLDAFATAAIPGAPWLKATLGQFKFPFGYNRMLTPDLLAAPDYGQFNSLLHQGGNPWDIGAKLGLKIGFASLDAAVVDGLGPNLGKAASGQKGSQDFSGLLNLSPFGGILVLGASLYQGRRYNPVSGLPLADSHLWWGCHAKFSLNPQAPKAWLLAEYMQKDIEACGVYGEAGGEALGLQAIAYAERRETYASAAAASGAWGLGLRRQLGSALALSLFAMAPFQGPGMAPQGSSLVIQTQIRL